MKLKAKEMIIVAEFAAIIAVLSQITIPFGLIPLTMQTFAVGFVATVLGKKLGTWSTLIYILVGLIGLPVFAEFSSGFGVFFGPTGGYLIGFIVNAWVTGWLMEKHSTNFIWGIAANLVGTFFTLLFGSLWLMFVADFNLIQAIGAGFAPFVLPGIIKAVGAALLGVLLNRRIPKLINSVK